MLSKRRGKDILASEVTAVGRDGFWIISGDREYFVPFSRYPAFKSATVAQIYDMREIAPGQLRWESLDEDIELEALQHPERFPLKFAA